MPVRLYCDDFVRARTEDLSHLLEYLNKPKTNKRCFQQLKYEDRRRVQSHNPFRIPRRMRAPILREFQEKPPNMPKRSRKDRRRPVLLSEYYEARNRKCRWLETHLWMAKRMHMVEKWGFKIAESPTQKCARKIYRYSERRACIYDSSYFSVIQIEGDLPEKALASLQCRESAPLPSIERFEMMAYGKEGPALGPVEVLKISSNVLWLISHPIFSKEVLEILKETCYDVREVDEILRFEIFGFEALKLFYRISKIDENWSEGCQVKDGVKVGVMAARWNHGLHYPTLKSSPSKMLLEKDINNVQCLFEKEALMKLTQKKSYDETYKITRRSSKRRDMEKLLKGPEGLERLQKWSSGKKKKEDRPKVELSEKVPCMLVKKVRHYKGLMTTSHFADGWDLYFPRNSGAKTMLALFRRYGGRVMGLSQRHQTNRRLGIHSFPQDFPFTPEGVKYWTECRLDEKAKWERTPKSKRQNFSLPGSPAFPFELRWQAVGAYVESLSMKPPVIPDVLSRPQFVWRLGDHRALLEAVSLRKNSQVSIIEQDFNDALVPVFITCQKNGALAAGDHIWSLETDKGFMLLGFVSSSDGHCLKLGCGAAIGWVRMPDISKLPESKMRLSSNGWAQMAAYIALKSTKEVTKYEACVQTRNGGVFHVNLSLRFA